MQYSLYKEKSKSFLHTFAAVISVIALIAFFYTSIWAAPTARLLSFDDALVTITQTPCKVPGLTDNKELQGGTVVFDDQTMPKRQLCWIEKDGVIGLIDEAGVSFAIPSEKFVLEGQMTPKLQVKPKTSITI